MMLSDHPENDQRERDDLQECCDRIAELEQQVAELQRYEAAVEWLEKRGGRVSFSPALGWCCYVPKSKMSTTSDTPLGAIEQLKEQCEAARKADDPNERSDP